MKIQATLTDGRTIEIFENEINQFSGQIILPKLVERGIANDIHEACELIGAAPSEIRYAMVHPNIPIHRII